MIISTNEFMESLSDWVAAMHQNDFHGARQFARDLEERGQLLTIHPDFARCLHANLPDVKPQDALRIVSQMLMCATIGRENDFQKSQR